MIPNTAVMDSTVTGIDYGPLFRDVFYWDRWLLDTPSNIILEVKFQIEYCTNTIKHGVTTRNTRNNFYHSDSRRSPSASPSSLEKKLSKCAYQLRHF